jgi:hypothetical protein
MKMARVLLLAVAAVAGTSLPGRVWSQAPTPYTIDVVQPDAVAGRRFYMRERVRVEVRDLNPFAGNYRIVVNEKAYSDSAITNFLAGLGITVPAAAPPSPKGFVGLSLAAASVGDLKARLRQEDATPAGCDQNCTDLRSEALRLVGRFAALQDTLLRLDSQDVFVRAQFQTLTSERSDSSTVMAALGSVIRVLQERVDRRHHYRSFLQEATNITSQVEPLGKRLESCPCAASARTLLDLVNAQKDNVQVWARWRDTLQAQAEKDLPALSAANSQASGMFVHVFEVGDYDYPTTVDIAIQRQPLGALNLAALMARIGAAAGGELPQTVSADGSGNPAGQAPDTAGFGAGWRTIANPRLAFGERRRIGLGGALVLVIGPQTKEYGTGFTPTTDSTITETRREPVMKPLLTLTTRLRAFHCPRKRVKMECAFNLHMGVSPSVTTRQTYFLGFGFAFADERMGLMAGALSLPVQVLQSGFSSGDKLPPRQTSAPTQDGRVWRLAVGLNLRPF